jgi:FkbM family methyltransferase
MLYSKVAAKEFRPSHVAEIGVWHPSTSNIYRFIHEGVKTTLVEPDPESIKLIKEQFKGNNVFLHEVAACDFNGKVDLYQRKSSSFVCNLQSSPAIVNDDYCISMTDRFTVNAQIFSEIDDGTIDLISIDTEGSEWFVIKNMVSRPAIISIETHGGMYTNPYLHEIEAWMKNNLYALWYKDRSDSVFVLTSVIQVELGDRIRLLASNFSIELKSTKRKLIKYFKGLVTKNLKSANEV